MEEILPLLEEYFGDWKSPSSAIPQKQINEVSLPHAGRLLLVDRPGSPQSLILAAHIAPPSGAENNIEIETMNDIIGGVYSARVNQNLRVDKQWSYGAWTLLPNARGQRPWLVYAPVQSDQTAAAIAELQGEFERFLASQPATREERDKIVRSSVFSLPGQYETNDAVLGTLLDNQRFGRADDYAETLKSRFEAVDLESVQAAAEQVIHPFRLTWVIVGDRQQIQQSLEDLQLAPIELMDADGNPLNP